RVVQKPGDHRDELGGEWITPFREIVTKNPICPFSRNALASGFLTLPEGKSKCF
ncbi:MAG: hypothetical protein JWM11_1292, partial [Planctomycetaceae bacterium]|nr:hypothetical protein [Planctomycetaceae bacterium]